MKKFLVIYHASPAAVAAMSQATPEQRAEAMKPWMTWNDRLGDKMLDLGAPLHGGQKVHADGSASPSEKEVTGYSIIQADDMKGAQALLDGHPHLQHGGCDIEIHEAMPM